MTDWRVLDWLPDYAISSMGEVRRETPGVNTWPGRILTQCRSRGYPVVGVIVDGNLKQIAVHRLVCEAFHGAKPSPGHQVAHGDGIRTNNAASNLRWATSKENHADRKRHGTAPTGTKNGRAKLTPEDAAAIRAEPKRCGLLKDLANRFGVSVGTITMVRQRNSPIWKVAA